MHITNFIPPMLNLDELSLTIWKWYTRSCFKTPNAKWKTDTATHRFHHSHNKERCCPSSCRCRSRSALKNKSHFTGSLRLHRTVPDYSRRIFGRKLLLLLLLLEATVLSRRCPESPLLEALHARARFGRHNVVVCLVPAGSPPRRHRVALNSRDCPYVSLKPWDSPKKILLLLFHPGLLLLPVPEVLLLLLLLPDQLVG